MNEPKEVEAYTHMRIVVIIPAYKPEERFLALARELKETMPGVPVVVIDDGSGGAYQAIFHRLELEPGCCVCRHGENRGKGAALKTGLRYASQRFPDHVGYVTADADGQHRPEDIRRVAEALMERPDSLVLGVREFHGSHVPAKSRFGNRMTSRVFKLITGVTCPDTQTGLRGIPKLHAARVLQVQGDRYEYEMNVLVEMAQEKIPFHMVPIRTVYIDGNRTSHFRPFRDSLLIYGRILRFALSSLLCALVDILVFTLLSTVFAPSSAARVLVLTAGARIISGVCNFTMNRSWVFGQRGRTLEAGLKYAVLFTAQMLVSGALVWALSVLPLPIPLVKVLVDGGLFLGGYLIQRRYIFQESREGSPVERRAAS
ncbi:MAG TPA: bifunctional glycosyltransferase family 2/GtrA family protein [Symbiobacteriaceae bacterium]|nr:bifunctional glycosyltransferase family 2/GtrA family protein [Symbiobacteriaceae bacterium]